MEQENKLFNPVDLELSRTTFDFHPTSTGTCNAGRLIPERCFFVQPGDSIKMKVRNLVKMVTPVYPTMDALFQDVAFFFVPYRAILNRRYGSPVINDAIYSWKAFIGAQDNLINMPLPAEGLKLPTLKINSNTNGYKPGSLIDYMDVYTHKTMDGKLSALPMMAYFAIWNENYRDPNTMNPVTWSIDSDGQLYPHGVVPIDATKTELNEVRNISDTGDYVYCNALGADDNIGLPGLATQDADFWLPFPVCRFHGYFGSLLPWPQRNAEGVLLPLGDSAPIVGKGGSSATLDDVHGTGRILFAHDVGGDPVVVTGKNYLGISDGVFIDSNDDLADSYATKSIAYTNLIADLSTATAANVNALRMAIQKQRWYEKLARSGNRYDELEYGLFGVRPHDSGDDRPQYLGGKRIPLSIEMVASTNGGDSSSSGAGAGSLGALGAYSHTNDEDEYFYHSFDDWGVVICVSCIRHHDTFGSGTDRFWTKLTRDDHYFPTFAHLGEQGTEEYELSDKAPDGAFIGYNPAWEEYRTQLDRVHGYIRPGKSLDFMTYARSFSGSVSLVQYLNASFQVETVDKTLSVTSNAAGFQFIIQKTFDMTWRRCMPTTSIPGLMDHF